MGCPKHFDGRRGIAAVAAMSLAAVTTTVAFLTVPLPLAAVIGHITITLAYTLADSAHEKEPTAAWMRRRATRNAPMVMALVILMSWAAHETLPPHAG